jgi:hypothetical protein
MENAYFGARRSPTFELGAKFIDAVGFWGTAFSNLQLSGKVY